VESQTTEKILQQVESDATLPSLDRSVLFEVILSVTQGGDHVAGQNADDDNNEDQGQTMSGVQESIAVEWTQRNPRKLSWLTTNMIVAYALSVVEDATPSTYRKAKISSESKK